MKRIIAFDPSYNTTGFAVVEGGQRLVAHGLIRAEGSSGSTRYASIMTQVAVLCRQYEVGKAAVEKPPSFAYARSTDADGKPRNLAAIQKCSNAAAVILGELGKLNISVVEIDAHKWKMLRGTNLNKKQMVLMAQQLFPVQLMGKVLSHHEAEAICMAVANF